MKSNFCDKLLLTVACISLYTANSFAQDTVYVKNNSYREIRADWKAAGCA